MAFIFEHVEKVAAIVVCCVEGMPPVVHVFVVVFRKVARRVA